MKSLMCLLLVVGTACQSSRTENVPTLQVQASYTATLVYALDGAIGTPRHNPGYLDWLLGPGLGLPSWLLEYQQRRAELATLVDDGRGPHEPYLRAAYEADNLDDLLLRLQQQLAPELYSVVHKALLQADRHLSGRWPPMQRMLDDGCRSLQELLESEGGKQVLRELALTTDVDPVELDAQVLLIAKPTSSLSFAHHQGGTILLEWSPTEDSRKNAGLLFHELAHLALHRSQASEQVEQSLAGVDQVGIVAANYWNEVWATTFGNGYAAWKLNPAFNLDDSFYNHPAIDALARDLFLRTLPHRALELDATFAQDLLETMQAVWPTPRWRMKDLFFRHVSMGDSADVLRNFSQRMQSAWASGRAPLVNAWHRPAHAPPHAPRVLLATLASLTTKAPLLRELNLSPPELQFRLSQRRAICHLGLDSDNVPWLLLVARDSTTLERVVESLDPEMPVPAPGWFLP